MTWCYKYICFEKMKRLWRNQYHSIFMMANQIWCIGLCQIYRYYLSIPKPSWLNYYHLWSDHVAGWYQIYLTNIFPRNFCQHYLCVDMRLYTYIYISTYYLNIAYPLQSKIDPATVRLFEDDCFFSVVNLLEGTKWWPSSSKLLCKPWWLIPRIVSRL